MGLRSGLLSDLQGIQVTSAMERGEIAPPLSVPEASNFLIALFHGLTSQQMANEPEYPWARAATQIWLPRPSFFLRASWTPR